MTESTVGMPFLSLPRIDWSTLGKEIGLGAALGFAVGYAAKKALKIALIVVATLILLAVFFEKTGFITVSWDALEASYSQSVKPYAVAGTITKVAQRLGRMIPVSGGFVAGFVLGFRYG